MLLLPFNKYFLFTSFLIWSVAADCQQGGEVFSLDTATVAGRKYIGALNDQGFILTDSKGATVLKHPGEFFLMQFKDFNNDGYKDIFLDHGGNTPERYSVLVFVRSTGRFKELKGLDQFPDPKPIAGTRYFYSYHKSGCADADWDSDLFSIDNYQAVKLGNISGRGCNSSGVSGAIYIFSVRKEEKTLLKTLSIDLITQYKDKWNYIRKYWADNYKEFI